MDKRPELSQADLLYRVRHSTSHIMAAAILEMFPDAKFAIGPPIKDGFYYDFELPRTISTDDLEEVESRMKKIIKGNHKFLREEWTKEDARAHFADQPYKLELIDGITDENVMIYKSGDFVDLCAGPHVGYTKKCKNFKLQKVAGAYWRGDEKRPMLQRIYGTAWQNKEQLTAHLHVLEEAKRRDHRRLGKDLNLFGFDRLAPGCVFWRPKGWTSYRALQDYFRELEEKYGYEEIHNPILYNKELFERSGHWDHYKEHMFVMEVNDQTYCLKPMNCPDTMVYFATKKRSYRELPLRVAEFGNLHRNELQGALSGATRVRQFCQDDAHIFATEDQIQSEVASLLQMVDEAYSLFGLGYDIELSTRPEEDFMGEIAQWNQAEDALRSALEANGKAFTVNEGDGAFYGPKIDFQVRDCLGRSWQCATLQLDFQLPQRFELTYTDSDNTDKTPVVIHRALAGSLERFFAILVEHFAGAFPTWVAPVQAVIMTITDDQADYAWEVAKRFKKAGIRIEVDDRGEKVGYKIREHELQKIPYMLVAGGKEAEEDSLAVRNYTGGRRGVMKVDDIIAEIAESIAARKLDVDVHESELVGTVEEDATGDEMAERGY